LNDETAGIESGGISESDQMGIHHVHQKIRFDVAKPIPALDFQLPHVAKHKARAAKLSN
jgi:hypothetical protein